MRPYHIEITWLDYSTMNQDDVYRVDIYDVEAKNVICTWQTSGQSVGKTISEYMRKCE